MKTLNNLTKRIEQEHKKEVLKILKDIKKVNVKTYKELSNIDGLWHLRQYFTPTTEKKTFKYLKDIRSYLVSRVIAIKTKQLSDRLNKVTLADCEQLNRTITITIEWKNNRTWGSNPTATSWVMGLGSLSSGSIGGCGYDKQSTAVANILNQIPQLRNALLLEMNRPKNKNKNPHSVFGYGSGYGITPYFEGGVGVSCYPEILKKIGFEFKSINTGSNKVDVYTITPLK